VILLLAIAGHTTVAQDRGSRPDSARILRGAEIELRNFTRDLGTWSILRFAPTVEFACEEDRWPYCFGFSNGGVSPGTYGTRRVEFRTSEQSIPRFMLARFDAIFRRHFARLDEAQSKLPGDRWLVGQRVFHHVERNDFAKADGIAASCRADRWWCAALVGFVAHSSRQYPRADSAFVYARSATMRVGGFEHPG
jgi:hypothetical protein